HGKPARREDAPRLRRHDQDAGAALAQLDVGELGLTPDLVAYPDVALESEGRARVHAPRQRDLGQYTACECSAVAAQLIAPRVGMEIEQMPAGRDRLALRRHLFLAIKGREHRLDRRLRDFVL